MAASYPPTPIHLAPVQDFTGGLNLRADAFQLAGNESPDMLDIELGIGGGFVQRKSVAPFAIGGFNVTSLFALNTTAGIHQTIAQANQTLWYTTGGAWTNILTFSTAGKKCRAVTFNNLFYGVHSPDPCFSWSGTTEVTLGQAYNNTIGGEGAADGNMPIAQLIAVHEQRVFVANTVESATAFPNRIRWSHAGFAEDWRAQDFIDIDVGHDGDQITAIVPFRGRLYIFKQNSTYELVGYGPENFQVVNLSTDIGCVSQEAALVTDVGLFTFSYPQGVYLDKGSGPYPIFDKLWPLVRDGWIPQGQVSAINMGWINKNLWMGIPWNGPGLLPIPTITSVAQHGTPGSTHYSYVVTATNGSGETLGSREVTTLTGNASLGASNYNIVTWTPVAGATGYKVYGRTLGAELLIATIGSGTTALYNDQGATPSGAMPTVNTAAIPTTFRTLVYNPWIYRHRYLRFLEGPWYMYSIPLGSMLEQNQPGGQLLHLGAHAQTGLVGLLEQGGQTDQWSINTAPTAIPSYYVTRWEDVGSPSVIKRWRHTDIVMRAGSTAQIRVDVKKNYDPSTITKTYYVGQSAAGGNLVWDDGSGTVGGLWDDGTGTVGGTWANLPTAQELITRGASMGTGRSVQLTFTGPANAAWGVDTFVLKFVPKRVRG